MSYEHKDFCFCTLALRDKYRLLAQQLASDLEKYAPGTKLLVLTDETEMVEEALTVMDDVAVQLSKLVTVTT